MLDLKQIKTFLAIHQHGSFSGAAEMLDIAQPTVSLHVKSLEKALGYDLFDRGGKIAVMTPAGVRFLPIAMEMIQLALKAQSNTVDKMSLTGSVNLCIVQSICTYKMPKILHQFQTQHPAVQIKITVNRPSTYMLEQLRIGELDASIVLESPFDIPSLASHRLWSDHLELVANFSHPLVQKKSVSYQQLANERFIFPEPTAHYRRLFERRFRERGIEPRVVLEIDNMESIKKSVMAGLGIAILPRYAVESEIENDQLVALPLEGRKLRVTAQLIWHREKPMSRAVKAFIEAMVTS